MLFWLAFNTSGCAFKYLIDCTGVDFGLFSISCNLLFVSFNLVVNEIINNKINNEITQQPPTKIDSKIDTEDQILSTQRPPTN